MSATDSLRKLFTKVSPGYDKVNRALSVGLDILWRRLALSLLSREVEKGDLQILDLAAGTGDFSVQAAKIFPSAKIQGVDITPAMMEIGKRKVDAAQLSERISFTEGNAMDLQFADNTFDCITCAFGFRNFPSAEKSLSEASRVLKKGGSLVVLEFFRPTSRLAKLLELWIGIVSRIFARSHLKEYRYLGSSIKNTHAVSDFISIANGVNLELKHRKYYFPCCSCLVFKAM
jgi:ubiquinone/menaquinone biosynthesis methyltransferase